MRTLIFLALFNIFFNAVHAQNMDWMTGTWNGLTTLPGNVTSTIQIDNVSRGNFSGIKTNVANGSHIKIVISGAFRGRGLYMQDGDVIEKDGAWDDCSSCNQSTKMYLSHDTLLLENNTTDCGNRCDGDAFYYRLLSEYDSSTQRYLADRFGRPSDIIGFQPFQTKENKPVATNNDKTPVKNDAALQQAKQDSLDNVARIKQQQADKTALAAQQKKRDKEISDSLNLAQQKNDKRLKDSLANVAKLEKSRLKTEDSLRNVQAKKRQQEVADSINLAKQNQQQRIKDSLDNIAKIKQQELKDAAELAQQKKREKEIADSLNLVQQREQQRIKDSLDNVARLEKIRLKTEDSLRDVEARKRQKEIGDSITLAQQKEQQRIKDSLQTVAAINLQKQKTADSLLDVQTKKRQQEIADSLAAIRKQQYNDSLQKAALAKVPKTAKDSSAEALKDRTNVLLGTYHITSPDILIELFDNGEIDGDRVSVYHNNENIVSNQTLGLKAITLNVHADAKNREHEFVLVAENLGTIPPNSALMRITAGKQTYKLTVNTDLKTNARIVFVYDGN